MQTFTFGKQQRLKSRKTIEKLFRSGNKSFKYPLRLHFLEIKDDQLVKKDSPYKIQCAVSVSKKKFRKAVDRNRVKRLMREAYRLQLPLIIDESQLKFPIAIMFVYIASDIESLSTIKTSVKYQLQKLSEEIRVDL